MGGSLDNSHRAETDFALSGLWGIWHHSSWRQFCLESPIFCYLWLYTLNALFIIGMDSGQVRVAMNSIPVEPFDHLIEKNISRIHFRVLYTQCPEERSRLHFRCYAYPGMSFRLILRRSVDSPDRTYGKDAPMEGWNIERVRGTSVAHFSKISTKHGGLLGGGVVPEEDHRSLVRMKFFW